MIRSFLMRVSLLGLFLILGGLTLMGYQTEQSWPGGIDPSQLPAPGERAIRIGLCGRPAELPLKALRRLPEIAALKLEFRTLEDPAQRWQLLAAGQLDVTIASLDELALAVPRFDPGVILFPVATASCDGLVQGPSAGKGTLLVAYPPGDTSRFLAEHMARNQQDRDSRTVAGRDPKQVLEWLKTGQVQAAALYEPHLSQSLNEGAKPVSETPRTPVMEVWVVSRAALNGSSRVSREELTSLCQGWFNLMDQMAEEPRLTQKAVAEENSLPLEQVSQALKATEFLELNRLQARGSGLQDEIVDRLNHILTSWSLFGVPNQKGADFSRCIDLSLLGDLKSGNGGLLSRPSPTPATPGSDNPEGLTPSNLTTPGPSTPTPSTPTPSTPTPEAAAGETAMLGVDPARTGVFATKSLQEVNSQAWRFEAQSDVATGVVLSAGNVLFGSDDGNVYCLSAERADMRWKFPCGDKVRSTPAVSKGMVFAGCSSGRLYALKLGNGEKVWSQAFNGEILASPVVVDGKLIVASMDGLVEALDLDQGKELWRYQCPGNVTSSPAVASGKVVVGCYDKKVYALDLETGKKVWAFATRGPVLATPCISKDLVYVGSQDKNMYALHLAAGDKAWQYVTGDEITCAAAVDQGVVCFGGRDCQIYGLDAATGKKNWIFPAHDRMCSGASIAEGVVYLGSEDKRLYAIDTATGQVKFRTKVDGWVSTPAIANGTVYFGSTDKGVYALR